MLVHPAFLEDMLIATGYAGDRLIYHIGTQNSIDAGIKHFFEHLDKNGQILIEGPEMVSYLNYAEEIAHIILYRSLSKLEYLEYKYLEKVDKNGI